MRWSGQIFWLLACGVGLTAHAHLIPAFTAGACQRLAYGKSYPVTAAQLLRFLTGFLAPIHGSNSQRTMLEIEAAESTSKNYFVSAHALCDWKQTHIPRAGATPAKRPSATRQTKAQLRGCNPTEHEPSFRFIARRAPQRNYSLRCPSS